MKHPHWIYKVNTKRTICEVCREIYDQTIALESQGISADDLVETRQRLNEIIALGKKINSRMYEISKRDNIEWWKENKNYEKALRNRLGYIDGTVHSVTENFDEGTSKKIARTLRVARKDAKAENMAARKARKEARKARREANE